MRCISVAALAALMSASVIQLAAAADLPVKAPVYKAPPAVVSNWTGFYFGAGVGYGAFVAKNSYSDTFGFSDTYDGNGGKGWLATVTVGYDLQVAQKIVAGVFADYDWTNLAATYSDNSGNSGKFKHSNSWSIGGRLGYLASPTTLLYVPFGYTRAKFDNETFFASFTALENASYDFNGWFLGAGAETQLGNNLSLRGEYRFTQFGAKCIACDAVQSNQVKPSEQTFRMVLAYRPTQTGIFGAGPAAAYEAPAMASASSWSGFYLGGGGGGGIFVPKLSQRSATYDDIAGKGWLATAIIGYDLQMMPRVVAGVFVDYDWANLRNTETDNYGGSYPPNREFKHNNSWSIGGRVGYLASPTTLLYVPFGYTRAKFDNEWFVDRSAALGTYDFDGWFLGAGAETQLGNNLSLRGEYRFTQFGEKCIACDATHTNQIKPSEQTVRLVLAYKFDWAPAGMAIEY